MLYRLIIWDNDLYYHGNGSRTVYILCILCILYFRVKVLPMLHNFSTNTIPRSLDSIPSENWFYIIDNSITFMCLSVCVFVFYFILFFYFFIFFLFFLNVGLPIGENLFSDHLLWSIFLYHMLFLHTCWLCIVVVDEGDLFCSRILFTNYLLFAT